jgi:single-strand DNA-binding protein
MLIAIIAGRIGNNAELKTTKNETSVVTFSVACDIGWGDKKQTEWIKATIFGKRADGLHPHLKKGTAITLTGEAKSNSWISKSGEAKGEISIVVDKITLQGSKQGSESQASNDASDNSEGDDIPF